MTASAPHYRFREARERLGLSHEDVAQRCGVSTPCVWDIESYADELTTCYSAVDIRRFGKVLQIRPGEFFDDEAVAPPVLARELAERIREECRTRKITLEQFEEVVGWNLSDSLQQSDRLLSDLTLDGLRSLCRELNIDWRRVLSAL